MEQSVTELIDWAQQELRVTKPWTIVTSQQKLSKTLFEMENDGRRYIGKVSDTQKRVGTYELMKRVWDAGMKPPSTYQIVEPAAWLPERSLLIQSKAPGVQIIKLIEQRDPMAMTAMELAGGWMKTLHNLHVELPTNNDLPAKLDRCERELNNPRVSAILSDVRDRLPSASEAVPSHADCHPFNFYVTSNGQITAIDLDTLSMREPAFDVANFAAQTAIMGYHTLGSFRATAELRKRFLESAPVVPQDRLQLHMQIALIRSLHYDLCLLKLKDQRHAEPFLKAAEHGIDA